MPNSETPASYRVLLIGGGGREHALAWKLRQSERVERLFVTHPANPGLASLGEPVAASWSERNTFELERFCVREKINLVVIGPEAPLAAGLADALRTPETAVFGPGAEGARLEADKAHAKAFMRGMAIPAAEGRAFTDIGAARAYLESRESACVVKASGLAAGKGVVVPETQGEALHALERIMGERAFGDAGAEVIIEERLKGVEASVFALIDGKSIYVLETCQDHKRLLEDDKGPNTGGMGAYCPARVVDDETMEKVERDILLPTLDGLRREGVDYKGVLYIGLMLTHGGPKVLEYNVRFGDPECQVLMTRWMGDLADTLWRTATGRLRDAAIEWDGRTSCCVTLASRGYPDDPEKGRVIEGVDDAAAMEGVTVFHAGTKREGGDLVTAGGRVLSVVALGSDLKDARERANAACEKIRFEGAQWRRDIGAGALVAAG